jgi:branched-chain amino acid transport system substrate-binding protein
VSPPGIDVAPRRVRWVGVVAAVLLASVPARTPAQAEKPIRIGISTAVQLQVGRDTVDGAQIAVDEINAAGGLLGRRLQMVVADETENPEQGIAAIKKLTGDDKVDVVIGGYTSGVTLAQLPHLSAARTPYLGVGAASPAITAKVKQDYEHYKYVFRISPLNSIHVARSLIDYMVGYLKPELGVRSVAIVGENAKWVQDLVPVLRKGAVDAGVEVKLVELFDAGTTDFSPLFSKVKASGAQYLIVNLSHASSDVFAKQWYDARTPVPYGGIDVKGQDANFFERVGGKSISAVAFLSAIRAPITPRTVPFVDAFVGKHRREPVYTGFGAYDAVHAYAEAVRRAGSAEREAVVKALEKTDLVATVGRIQLDEAHDVKPGPGLVNLLWVQWQEGGKRVVVWPKDLRNGKFVPPPWVK